METVYSELERIGLHTPDRCHAGAPPENGYTRVEGDGIVSYYFNLQYRIRGNVQYALNAIEEETRNRGGEYQAILFKFPEDVEKAGIRLSSNEKLSR